MIDWEDLRFFLAVARAGSLSGAARHLAVNHSTVYRRIGAIEATVGARLFERHAKGYVLTVAGEAMRDAAGDVDAAVAAAERAVAGRDLNPRGSVRITTTDTLAHHLLPPHLAAFHDAYPEITLELIVANEMLNLTRREADVAIRPVNDPQGAMVGRRFCDIAFAVYASPAYLERRGVPANLDAYSDHSWIGYDESLGHLPAAGWMAQWMESSDSPLSSNNIGAMLAMARAGSGLAALPCFMGDGDRSLVRVSPPEPDLVSGLWLLTHPDLRRTARVRAVLDFLGESLSADRTLLEGRLPQRGSPSALNSAHQSARVPPS